MRQLVIIDFVLFLPALPVTPGAYISWALIHVSLYRLAHKA